MTPASRLLPVALCAGCAVQLTSGVQTDLRAGGVSSDTRLRGRFHSSTREGLTLGAGMSFGEGPEGAAFAVRAGEVSAGYGWRPRAPLPLGGELSFDIGYGGPVSRAFNGGGFFLGGSGAVQLRVFGMRTERQVVRVLAPTVDIVLVGRTGVWTPPPGDVSTAPFFEIAGELGIRFGVQSALASSALFPVSGGAQ